MARRVLPKGLTFDSIERVYERELLAREDELVAALEHLLSREVEAGVASAAVTVVPDYEEGGRVAVSISFDGPGRRLGREDEGLFAGRRLEPFGDLGLPLLADAHEREDEPIGRAIAEWVAAAVARAWWKAGGWRYPLPVVLQVGEPGDTDLIALSRAGRESI